MQTRSQRASWSAAVIVAALALTPAGQLDAQLRGHYIPGFTGLQNGTQPPRGYVLLMPVYFYPADDIRGDDGESLGLDASIDMTFIGLGVAWSTKHRFLGATLGGSAIPFAFMKSRVEGRSLDLDGSFAFTDAYVQPLQLGWRTSAADLVLGYGFFLPTGEWELGATDNAGLGMWSQLIQAGTTVKLDRRNAWTFSTLGSYEWHTKKEEGDIRVGDILTVEGGLGRSFHTMDGSTPVPSRITTLGLVYYGQFKLASDEAPVITPILEGRKDRVWGIGAEANIVVPRSGLALGLRVATEFEALNRTQGWTFMLNTGYVLRSLVTTAGASTGAASPASR